MIAIRKSYSIRKKVVLKKTSTKNEAKELTDRAPSTVFLICKAAMKSAKKMNIDEIIFYSKSRY